MKPFRQLALSTTVLLVMMVLSGCAGTQANTTQAQDPPAQAQPSTSVPF